MNFIYFIFVLCLGFKNYELINYRFSYDVADMKTIIFLVAIASVLVSIKSYKDISSKNKFSIFIKNTITTLFISSLFSYLIMKLELLYFENFDTVSSLSMTPIIQILASILGLAILFCCVFVVPMIIAFIPKQVSVKINQKNIKKEKENELKIKNELDISIKKCISDFESDSLYYPKKYNDENSYTYDDMLNINSANSKKIYVNNEEKISYYEDLFKNLNSRYYGNYNDYTDNLIKKFSSIVNELDKLGYSFSSVKNLANQNRYKLNSFERYINTRNNYMSMDYRGCKVGIEGEERVNQELSLYTNIINLENIRLEVSDNSNNIQSIENDNILLTRSGIYILEVKNFGEIGNYDIVIEKDGRWLRKNRNGGEISLLKNVTKQNNRHIGLLNKFINESINRDFDSYIETEGIVVIANEKVKIENYNDNQKVFRDSEIYSYIKSKPAVLTKEELDVIREVILKNNLEPQRFPIYNYNKEIIDNICKLEKYIGSLENLLKDIECKIN